MGALPVESDAQISIADLSAAVVIP